MFYGHMRHLLSAMSVRLWIVMYNEAEIGAELGSVFAEEHTSGLCNARGADILGCGC